VSDGPKAVVSPSIDRVVPSQLTSTMIQVGIIVAGSVCPIEGFSAG
jgi:hypothetical protein